MVFLRHISEKDYRTSGNNSPLCFFFLSPLNLALRGDAPYHSRCDKCLNNSTRCTHLRECESLRDRAPGRRMRTRATSSMCNHSINYVTARSRLFLLRTRRPRSARRGGSANSPIPFAPPRSRPPFLFPVVLSRSTGTPSRTFLRSVARKRKENTDGISPG